MKSKGNVFKGLLKVIILAIVIFVLCYFLLPDFSGRFFGVSKNGEYVREEGEEVGGFEGQLIAFVGGINEATKNQTDAIKNFLESDDAAEFVSKVGDFATLTKDKATELLESEEGQKFVSAAKSALDPETYKKLIDNITKTDE